MAGYFDYLGRVFTEKGSWYKILMIVALQGIAILFSPKAMIQQVSHGTVPEFNIPGIVLYILASTLIFGFVIQIYRAFMNDKPKLLPDVDFLNMFTTSLRLIPFGLVWMIYLFIAGVFLAMAAPAFASVDKLFLILFSALMFICILVFAGMIAVLMIIHAKSFSYKYVLNPVTAFRVLPRVIGPMALLILLYGIVNLILYGLLFGGAVLMGISGEENSVSAIVAFGILLLGFGYLNNAFSFAYSLKLADIVKTRLADTEYLDSDFELPAEEEEPDSDDTLDY
ncbi:MAG: hypothetical protein NC390_07885 [Fusobacterium sp.]|nr:hypothetical protein [Fusobacterium sp.]